LAVHLRQEHRVAVEYMIGEMSPTSAVDYQSQSHEWSPLVILQEGYGTPPLFLVHPVGGNVFCYGNLARELGPEYTIYGLQARGLDEGQNPHTQIEAMASEYLAAIRDVEPIGPYQLAGWSMGALIAVEMARQLRVRREDVSFLGLIDPTDPQTVLPGDTESLLLHFAFDLGVTPDHLTRPLDDLSRLDFDDQLSYLLELAKSAGVVPADVSVAYLRRLFAVFQNNVRAIRSHRAAAYDGEIRLFAAQERRTSDPATVWSKLALGSVEVHIVPGNHYSMLKPPHVQTLAQQLKASLFFVQSLCTDSAQKRALLNL